MKRSALDTSDTTLQGSISDGKSAESPPRFTARLLSGSVGTIGESEEIAIASTAPLHVGRRSTSPSAAYGWLHLPDERASREHARLFVEKDRLFVEDQQSRNGTSINGTTVAPGTTQMLSDGDVLRCGDAFLMIRHQPELADVRVTSVIGQSLGARLIRRAIVRNAVSRRALLLLGETGTGKEVVAQAIHKLSQSSGRLVAVNCAAIPETLAEAQFFGVKKGAYSGAIEQPGAFVEAHLGTLFLDEVGELPLLLQPKLLRAIETREVTPVGSQRPLPCDVRLLSATNRDLHRAMAQKEFREDLYARLAGEVLPLPPLRERREDILLLARHFAGSGFAPSPKLVAGLLAHGFPFNIRELVNLIGRLRDGSEEDVLQSLKPVAVPSQNALPASAKTPVFEKPRWKSGDPPPRREQVIALLTQHRGNLYQIERECGYSRRQFRRWAEEKYGLDLAQYRARNDSAEADEE